MNIKQNKSGFTLLEIIIVIIIVGVLASLALPRFFSTVEYSRSTEALASIGAVRQSLERCYLQRSGDYTNCANFGNLDIEDPGNSPGAHFTYSFPAGAASVTAYAIKATRNLVDGGSAASMIVINQAGTAVTRSGVGAFAGIK